MISILLLLALLASMFVWPIFTPWISLALGVVGIGTPVYLAVKKHWQSFNNAKCTREKMLRNLSLDLAGFFLTMAAATYIGATAGGFAAQHAGAWPGLLAGFAGGFAASWGVRAAWGRLALARG